ncbi:hypothetical protein B0H14DRAFT_1333879 [Mycena olivaceomarginata]|nr:hypothetical protein B0H14DRAFT_1333879 [Mycena olivaceomarginata]
MQARKRHKVRCLSFLSPQCSHYAFCTTIQRTWVPLGTRPSFDVLFWFRLSLSMILGFPLTLYWMRSGREAVSIMRSDDCLLYSTAEYVCHSPFPHFIVLFQSGLPPFGPLPVPPACVHEWPTPYMIALRRPRSSCPSTCHMLLGPSTHCAAIIAPKTRPPGHCSCVQSGSLPCMNYAPILWRHFDYGGHSRWLGMPICSSHNHLPQQRLGAASCRSLLFLSM